MLISRYVLLFILYSFAGWIFECLYCILTTQHWENRGFLYGPICPIYGAGAVTITVIVRLMALVGMPSMTEWQIFLLAFLGSIPLEYFTHMGLEKIFHACWWDYSNLPFNLNGRICLPASILFGFMGVTVIYYAMPLLEKWLDCFHPLFLEGLSLLITGIFGVDTALTAAVMTNFALAVEQMNERLNQHMEAFVEKVAATPQQLAEEQEKFIQICADRFVSNINDTYRVTMARVRGIRMPVSSRGFRIASYVVGTLRQRVWERPTVQKAVHTIRKQKNPDL